MHVCNLEKGLYSNLRQLEEVIKQFPTYLISPLNYENHAFYVIKYFFLL